MVPPGLDAGQPQDPQGRQAPQDPLPLRPLRLPRHADEQLAQAFQVQARRGGRRCQRGLVPLIRHPARKLCTSVFLKFIIVLCFQFSIWTSDKLCETVNFVGILRSPSKLLSH
jgi:hypothetical protein